MEVRDAIELSRNLESDILTLLLRYRDVTGITPSSVNVQTADVPSMGRANDLAIIGVRVGLELRRIFPSEMPAAQISRK